MRPYIQVLPLSCVKSFISTLAIVAIHFWLSFRLKNLFLNIGIGLAGVVVAVSMYIPHWPSIIYLPYAFPVLMCNFIPAPVLTTFFPQTFFRFII